MTKQMLIVGGGIGGLAAAVAARQAHWDVRLFEQAEAFSEVGAGIQMGPNSTRILREWGLLDGELGEQVCRPQRLRVRDALDGGDLASMAFDAAFERRYGAPYLTVHRADLQSALLEAARARGTRLQTGARVQHVRNLAEGAQVETDDDACVEADALVAADGLWSASRALVAGEAPPRRSGHLAYRGIVRMEDLPEAFRAMEVTAWLGPLLHLVTYPVHGGKLFNVVCVVDGLFDGDPRGWDHVAARTELKAALGPACSEVHTLIDAVPQWRLWALHDRDPVAGPDAMANGRVALLGDAAHPMRPYLAQGAGMAIEDARELQRVLELVGPAMDVPMALRRYALNRWERCARVQQRSRRNADIFHATGLVRVGRNLALRTLGPLLLDQPWLYRG